MFPEPELETVPETIQDLENPYRYWHRRPSLG